MMVFEGYSSLMALLLFIFGVVNAIRTLKDGPMIDEEGREYKSSPVPEKPLKPGDGLTVHVQCTETSMIIFIKPDLFRNGNLASPEELFLGGVEHSRSTQCRVVGVGNDEYVIEAGLQDCGSKLTVSEDDVTYSNNLVYSPIFKHHSITRKAEAVVPVSCHYQRTHTVSSYAQQQPFSFSRWAKFSAGKTLFSLKLMTSDWSRETLSSTYKLGDLLHLEASYTGPDQKRIFIDSCVATLTPDPASVPRYYFIENYGCLTDAKEEGSKARFPPRPKPDVLQLELDAFLFRNDLRNKIYFTCELKATSRTQHNSPIHKACNYVHSRWRNVDGIDGVCQCCDGFCYTKPHMDDICDVVTLGPFIILPKK